MVPSNDKGTIVYDSKTEKIKKDHNSCNIFDLRTKNSFKASLEILEHRKEFIKSTIKTIRNLSRDVDGYEQNLKKNNKDIEYLNLKLAEIASNLAVKNSNRESDNAGMLEEQQNRFTIRLHKHTIKKRTIESEIKKVKTELRKEQNHILNMFEIHLNTISEESSVSKHGSISSELTTNNAIYGLEMNLVGSPENSEGYISRSISKTDTDDENNDNLVLMNSIIEGETSTNPIANDNIEDSGNAVKQKSISADSLTEPENKSLIDSDVEEDVNESESSSDIDFDKDKETNELNGSYTDILSGIRNDVANDEKDIGQSGSVHSSSLMNKVPCILTDVHESSIILEQKADDVLIKNVPVIESLANDEIDGNLIDNDSLSKDELVIQQTPNEASKDVMLQAKSVPLVSEDNQKPSMNEVVNDTTHNNGTTLNLVKDQNNNSLSPSPPKPFSEPEPEPKTDDKNSGVDERYIWIGSSVVVISASLAALYLLKYRH